MEPDCAPAHTSRMRILLAALCASALSAGTITVSGVGYGRKDVVMVTPNGNPYRTYATEIQVLKDGQSVLAYCVDLFTSIGMSTYNNTTGLPDSYQNGERAAWLFENYAGLVNSNDAAAALQVALWDVVHDNGDGFNSGLIRLGTSETILRTAADTLVLNSVGQGSFNATILYNFEVGTDRRMQTLITGPPPSGVETPEPATIAMIGFGLAATYGFQRWRKART
jgi:hypothetical protein